MYVLALFRGHHAVTTSPTNVHCDSPSVDTINSFITPLCIPYARPSWFAARFAYASKLSMEEGSCGLSQMPSPDVPSHG